MQESKAVTKRIPNRVICLGYGWVKERKYTAERHIGISLYRILKARLTNLDMICRQWEVSAGKLYDQYDHLFFYERVLPSLTVLWFQSLHSFQSPSLRRILTVSTSKSTWPSQSPLKFSFPVWLYGWNGVDVVNNWHDLNSKKALAFHNPGNNFFYLSCW